MSNLILFFIVCFNFLTILCGLGQGSGTPATTALTSNITAAQTTIPVMSTVGFALSDYIWVGNERMAYTSTDATNFLSVTRGVADQNGQGGTAATANSGSQVYTEGMNAINSMIGFNYSSLQLTYGTPVALILGTFAYIGAIPRFIYWNVGFMTGSSWSIIKIIILYPLTAGLVLALMFWCIQIIWMLKPNVL